MGPQRVPSRRQALLVSEIFLPEVGQCARRRRPMIERLHQYVLLMRLHRPIGILLLLWPTLWALWLAAGGLPDLRVLWCSSPAWC